MTPSQPGAATTRQGHWLPRPPSGFPAPWARSPAPRPAPRDP